jgi:MFS family permease
VNTIFSKIYAEEYPSLPTTPLVPSIVFAGLVFGQLLFGYISDKCGRRVGMVAATIIVILFSALCAGAWYPTVQGMMIMFTIWRFCLGVGVGAEYPAGSVAASEATAETNPGRRHGLFIMVTNFVIDFGFVLGNMVPCLLVVHLYLRDLINAKVIFSERHLRATWRIAVGLGCIPPLSVFYFRLKMEEPERYQEDGMRNAKTPYALVFKTYWKRLLAVGGVWFLYNFMVYPFNMYSSYIIDIILPPGEVYPSQNCA